MRVYMRWSIALGVALLMTAAAGAEAQVHRVASYRSGVSGVGVHRGGGFGTGGYSYVAPSYRVGLSTTSFGVGRGYGAGYGLGVGHRYGYGRGYYGVGGSSAYLYGARGSRLNYLPARYQTGYGYGYGLGVYGYRGYGYGRVPPYAYSGYGGLYGLSLNSYYGSGYYGGFYPSFGASSLTLYPTAGAYAGSWGGYYQEPAFTPYVATAQYVYTPTYTTLSYGAPYGAVCGSYGYSAIFGY